MSKPEKQEKVLPQIDSDEAQKKQRAKIIDEKILSVNLAAERFKRDK
jgi:hypothetical protein